MNAATVAARISKQAAAYNSKPFTKGVATILVVTDWVSFRCIVAELRKDGGRLSENCDYVQQGNVITKWIALDCPRHLLFGQSAILVLRDRSFLFPRETLNELENTLIRARMAKMPQARVELI